MSNAERDLRGRSWDDGAAFIAHQVRDAFAPADEQRMRELDELIRRGYGSTDPKNIPADELASPAPAAPPATQEATMPCSVCKSKDHNARTCSQKVNQGRAAPAVASTAASPRPPQREKRGRATFGVLDEFAELEGRAKDRLAEIDAEVRGHQEQIQELNDEAQQLRQRLGMDRPTTAPARAVG